MKTNKKIRKDFNSVNFFRAIKEKCIEREDMSFEEIKAYLKAGSEKFREQIAKGGEEAAILGEDCHARAALGHRQLTGVGQGEGEIAERPAADDRAPQTHQHGQLGGPAQETSPRVSPRAPATLPAAHLAAWRGRPQPLVRPRAQ